MSYSEVEELCQKILAEYEAMKRGPIGFALGISKHAFIEAHLKRVDSYHTELSKHIGDQAATMTICELYQRVMG
jgi:F420-0:gamma-glutamyl ligase